MQFCAVKVVLKTTGAGTQELYSSFISTQDKCWCCATKCEAAVIDNCSWPDISLRAHKAKTQTILAEGNAYQPRSINRTH